MNGGWQFVVHQDAMATMESMRGEERRQFRRGLETLLLNPYQRPDAEQRSPHDRIRLIKYIGPFQVSYWLDHLAKELRIVTIERVRLK